MNALRNLMTKSMFTLGLFLLIGTAAASAQNASVEKMTIDVPFQFSVGEQQFSAGTYTFAKTSQTGMAYTIRNKKDARQVGMTIVKSRLQSGHRMSPTKLVFDVYEGKYFLAQIWGGFDNVGSELYQSRARREVAQHEGGKQTVVLLAAR